MSGCTGLEVGQQGVEELVAIQTVAGVELLESGRDLGSDLLEVGLPKIILVSQQSEGFADDFACRAVTTTFDVLVDERFELRGE